MDHSAQDQQEVKRPEDGESDSESGGDVVDLTAGSQRGALNQRPPIPRQLPVLPVRNAIVFPGTVVPLTIGREKSKRLIDAVLAGDKLLAICTQRRAETEDPTIDDIYRVGTAAQVMKLLRMPDGTNTLLVHGIVRIGIEEFVETEPYWQATVNEHDDQIAESTQLEALAYGARQTAERVIELSPNVPEEALQILNSIDKPGALADFLAANLSLGIEQKQELLETFDVPDRLRKVSATLQNQLEVLELAEKIQTDVRKEIDDNQRRYYLQEQLKAIQKELGEDDPRAAELSELKEQLAKADLPEDVRKEADRELDRYERLGPASPENSVIRDYLQWLIDMPWRTATTDNLDLDQAQEILDKDHYGLDRIKRRIIEHLAVRKLNPNARGSILCFAGPPGVGKTSLGKSIARALGRNFIRIALGGVRDEADIRGHRRTYIGAIPGRIVQEIRKAGSNNPLIMLDELDKIGRDYRGDPAAALLEVLDPEQNSTFTDHYLGVPFDLSQVMFIGTANYMDPVDAALKDRMEVIALPGYTTHEKLEIAKRYLVPRQMERTGVATKGITFTDDVIRELIERYTREAGVRNLERNIGTVCRALAAKIARNVKYDRKVKPEHLTPVLGPPHYERQAMLEHITPGVVTGLAYTPVGGEIIIVEARMMPGRGSLTITGQVRDVMRESVQAALSVVRSNSELWNVSVAELGQSDLHVHVPSGAIPKDGPSAGVAMVVALYTLLTGLTADPGVAMTGEITLRGRVLPVGGIKEKVMGAHRAGIRRVILPEQNQFDLHDVPEEVRDDIAFVYVKHVEDALEAAVPEAKISRPVRKQGKPSQARKKSTLRGASRPAKPGSKPKSKKPASRKSARGGLAKKAKQKPGRGGSRTRAR